MSLSFSVSCLSMKSKAILSFLFYSILWCQNGNLSKVCMARTLTYGKANMIPNNINVCDRLYLM